MEIDAPDVTVVACCQVAPALGIRRRTMISPPPPCRAPPRRVPPSSSCPSWSPVATSSRAGQRPKPAPRRPTARQSRFWARLAADHGVVVVGGFCELASGDLFNSAALVDPGGLRGVYRKAHLWDRESLWFSPGSAAPPVIPTRFGRIAVMICYDLEFPEWVRLPSCSSSGC
jgi:5-aminopentanamidase